MTSPDQVRVLALLVGCLEGASTARSRPASQRSKLSQRASERANPAAVLQIRALAIDTWCCTCSAHSLLEMAALYRHFCKLYAVLKEWEGRRKATTPRLELYANIAVSPQQGIQW